MAPETTTNVLVHRYVTPQGGMLNLGTLGGDTSQAYAVNEGGSVVGGSTTADGHGRGFFWTPELGMIDIGTLGGTDSGVAVDVNASGQVVGGA